MRKWSVQGNTIELSDYDYYNQWIGIIEIMSSLGGLLGGYFDMHDKNGNILERHAQYLHENIHLVEDKVFRALLSIFEAQFMEIIALEQDAIATLSQVLGLEMPKTVRDYKLLYKNLEREHQYINPVGLLSHPAFDELRQRFSQIAEKRYLQRKKLLSYILAMIPDLSHSEYLRKR